MNEKYLKKILSVEAEAQAAYDQAIEESNQLPAEAQKKVEKLLEKTRDQAHAEAEKILQEAYDQSNFDETQRKNENEIKKFESHAAANHDRAVEYVIKALLGGET